MGIDAGNRDMNSASRSRVWFTLAILLGINAMNFYDRQILPAVQEKIRKDWANTAQIQMADKPAEVQESIRKKWELTDRDIGGLGTAFILLYAVVGLPLGRLADVIKRKWILAAGVAVWSVMTLASGFAWSYWSLFIFRLGVGVGEASCAPAASSLIGDLVPVNQRARAMSIFMLGLPIGLASSFIVSGTIADKHSWQAAFWVACIPGILLAIAALWIEEPGRLQAVASTNKGTQTSERLSFAESTKRILRNRTIWWIIASGALHNFNMYALGTFWVSFLIRYHNVGAERAGLISGLVCGFGALGIFIAGWLGDWAFRRGKSGRLQVAWIAIAAAIPFLLIALATPAGNPVVCSAWMLFAYLLMYSYYGTVYATIQDIVEPALRGTAMALYFFAMYLLGGVAGPFATGFLSDLLSKRAAATVGSATVTEFHKAIGLHEAMYIVPLFNVLLAGVLFAATQTIGRDLDSVKRVGDEKAESN